MFGVRNHLLFLSLALMTLLSACAEPVSSGALVPIPRVVVDCRTSQCRTNSTPRVFVFITTSGCQSIDYGGTRTAVVNNLTCNGVTGCRGEIAASAWADANNRSTTTIPSGTYSLCARVDYNRSYPADETGDSVGELNNVAIGDQTALQTVAVWQDL